MSVDLRLVDDDLPEVTELVRGLALVQQRVRTRLQTGVGEWLLDRGAGLPLLQWLEEKAPDASVVAALIRDDLVQIPQVIRAEGWSGTFDVVSRVVRVSGTLIVRDDTQPDTFSALSVALFSSTEGRDAWLFGSSFGARAIPGGPAGLNARGL